VYTRPPSRVAARPAARLADARGLLALS